VTPIAQEQDIEVLRQQALLLETHVQSLLKKNAELLKQLNDLKGGDAAQLILQLHQVNADLDLARQRMFGDSSEKLPREKEPKAKSAAGGHGRREQPNLPHVEQLHALDESERVCDSCGGALTEWEGQVEESPEITVQARSYSYVIHKRQKYRCKCGGCIKTAPGPLKLKPGCLYSVDFAIDVAVAKYAYHLPLERQVRMMAGDGLTVDSQTLWDQIEALAVHLEPTKQALHSYVLSNPVIGADETHWQMLSGLKKTNGKTKRWHVWAVVTEDAVSYQLHNSRSTDAASQVLTGYQGVVLCDGYAAYNSLKNKGGGFQLAHCWAHVRRKFFELKDVHPHECNTVLDYIGQLYAVEQQVRDAPFDERLRIRQQQSKPILDRIRKWSFEVESLPTSALRKALVYMGGMWDGLLRFLENPLIEIDNNRVERSLRAVVLGRKNHLGSRSERGTEVAALYYSLIESARLNSKDPTTYLRTATRAALAGERIPLPHEA
jgi:transposase